MKLKKIINPLKKIILSIYFKKKKNKKIYV